MQYDSRSSFIPQSSGQASAIPMQIQKKRPIRIFGFLGTVILLASLLSATGVYFYERTLTNQLQSAKAELSSLNADATQQKINEVRTYDSKLKIADNLLENHISSAQIFTELERTTKETIQFSGVDFTNDPGFEALIKLSGNTEAFTSVALQQMQYLKDSLFSEFTFTNITANLGTQSSANTIVVAPVVKNTETDGKVSFSVTGLFKKDTLKYTGEHAVQSVNTLQNDVSNISSTTITAPSNNAVTP
jgi:hypothetical protein